MTNIQKCGVIGVGFVGATWRIHIGGFRTVRSGTRGYEPRQGYRWKLRTSIMVWRSASRAASWPETMLTSPNAVLSSLRQAQNQKPGESRSELLSTK